jgi:caffeoyl-CoA O-methyltransferase
MKAELEQYAERHSGFEPAYLKELAAETREKVADAQMLSGHLQGRFLSLLSHLVKPEIIIEIGTFTAYSTLCLAEGLAPGGKLHTIDVDKDLNDMRERYIRKAAMEDRIVLHNGPALFHLKSMPTPFDLVFIDADKKNYPNYFDRVVDKVRPGGLIIADNLLWSGQVLNNKADHDADTAALVEYAERLHADPRVQPVLVPMRDGLMVARKK